MKVIKENEREAALLRQTQGGRAGPHIVAGREGFLGGDGPR
jgi:hypothetical protein